MPVDIGALVSGEAGQQRWEAGQPALDPAADLPSQVRQRPMWPPQAWRVPPAVPRDEAAPPQVGLHPGVAPLDPLRLPQPFMTVPHVKIEGLLSIEPHALCVNRQGAMPRTGPHVRQSSRPSWPWRSEYGVQWHRVRPEPLRIEAPWSQCSWPPMALEITAGSGLASSVAG